ARMGLAKQITEWLMPKCVIQESSFDRQISEYLKLTVFLNEQIHLANELMRTLARGRHMQFAWGFDQALHEKTSQWTAPVVCEPMVVLGRPILAAQFLAERSRREAMTACVKDLHDRCRKIGSYVVDSILLSGAMHGLWGVLFWPGKSECWYLHNGRTT